MSNQYNIASYLRTGTVLRHKLTASTYHYAVFVDEKIGTMGFSQNVETGNGVFEIIPLRRREWEIVTDIPQLLEPEEIKFNMKEAYKRFKQSGEAPKYNVKSYNCEHWATEIVAGTPDSKQARERLLLILKSGGAAGAAGVVTGPAVMSLVMSFAAASTGTAISTLSGAAATNAALAWLGGGAIAAGGGGMVAGAMMLAALTTGGAAIAAIGIGFAAWKALSSGQSKRLNAIVTEYITLLKKGELSADLAFSGVDIEENAKKAVQTLDKAYFLGASFAKPEALAEIQNKIATVKDEYPQFFEPTQWDKVMGSVIDKVTEVGNVINRQLSEQAMNASKLLANWASRRSQT
ncbi:MAG: hypothetical protein IGR76_06830 [Synechococcales cyanobacterium T60_A2020_003]|nr:hypothetical protein [Synechococcales cyanobacterium T60_A2020_003]